MVMLGGWRWPWEGAKTPVEAITKTVEATIATPSIVPAGAPLAIVTKNIFKVGALGALVAGGAGFLAGSLLGGGGTQTVAPEQITTVTPELTAEQKQILDMQQQMRDLQAAQEAAAEATAEVAPIITPIVSPVSKWKYDVTAGGSVDIGGSTIITTTPTTTTTSTITHAGVSQEVIGQLSEAFMAAQQTPQQITIVMPEQQVEAKQEGGNSWIIAAAIVAAALLFGGKK